MSDLNMNQIDMNQVLMDNKRRNAGLASDPRSVQKSLSGKSDEDLRQAAEQFESMFVNMVFQKMREMVPESEVFGSKKVKFFESMLYDEYSKAGTQQQGLGLADMIYKQFESRMQPTDNQGGDKS